LVDPRAVIAHTAPVTDGEGSTTEPDTDPALSLPVPRGPADGQGGGPTPAGDSLLVPGETCWRIERATRHAVFVDAAEYFATLKRAVLAAQRRGPFIRGGVRPPGRVGPPGGPPAQQERAPAGPPGGGERENTTLNSPLPKNSFARFFF